MRAICRSFSKVGIGRVAGGILIIGRVDVAAGIGLDRDSIWGIEDVLLLRPTGLDADEGDGC